MSTDRGSASFSFKFVCERGELEVKSLLLAASLREYVEGEYELVAGIPEAPERAPRSVTMELLDRLDVRRAGLRNPIGDHFPIANKIPCLGLPTSADLSVFLDSDILCLHPLRLPGELRGPLAAKPADMPTFGEDLSNWRHVYESLGHSLPDRRLLSTFDQKLMPPYFNAGVICVAEPEPFAVRWAELSRILDRDEAVDSAIHLDQISLPVVVLERGLEFHCLDEHYNFPAHLKPLPLDRVPILLHYHWAPIIRREPLANALVVRLAEKYPELREVMQGHEAWRQLLLPYQAFV